MHALLAFLICLLTENSKTKYPVDIGLSLNIFLTKDIQR